MNKKGVLLINLGTPDHANGKSVYRYLTEFLNDPRVIDLPSPVRWILTNLIIVPFRHRKSAAAYQKIWTEDGSPLLVNSRKLADKLAIELGDNYQVALAMRYGNPTIQSALTQLEDCAEIIGIPLFPQYSSAATGSALEKMNLLISKRWNIPSVSFIKDFYNNAGFIAAYVDVIQKNLAGKKSDHLVLSFHGLPERHITKSLCKAQCDHVNACPVVSQNNEFCYRAQCYETAALIVKQLGMKAGEFTVAFQSRIGRTPWIKPYTDFVLPELRAKGIKNIAVVCPSFVADCLETLEEVNIRAHEQWTELGGEEFTFIPCLNDNPVWVKSLAGLIITAPV